MVSIAGGTSLIGSENLGGRVLHVFEAPEMKVGTSPRLSLMAEVQSFWTPDGFGLAVPSASLFTSST